MYKLTDIRRLEIEPTNLCQARCPQCMRTPLDGSVNHDLNDSLELDVFKNIPDSFWAQLESINFNGTTGDCMAHRDIADIIEYIRPRTSACISLHTNGGLGSRETWVRLAKTLKESDRIVFGIDGVGIINQLYRVGVSFDHALTNAEIFIQHGGSAEWQYIAFRHNEEYIPKAQSISESSGFKKFTVRSSGRFDSQGVTRVFINGKQSHVIEKGTVKVDNQEPERRTNISSTCIDCESIKTKWLAIYADGTVWPCCHLMGWHKTHHFGISALVNKKLEEVIGDYSVINLHHHSLESIINSPVFQNRYPDSFESNRPIPICISECRVDVQNKRPYS